MIKNSQKNENSQLLNENDKINLELNMSFKKDILIFGMIEKKYN